MLTLTACASGRIDTGYPFPIEPAAPASSGAGKTPLRQMQVHLDTLLIDGLSRSGVKPQAAGLDDLMSAVSSSPDRMAIRNDVVSAIVAASTANCTVYVQALRSGQVNSRLLTDLFAGGLATASSIAVPPASAKLLSALSALSTAEGSSVDRNIFAQQSAELIADAILQLRSADLAAIRANMKTSYDDWSLGMALADLFSFQGDCSMVRGFSKMRDALTAREQAVQSIRAAAGAVEKAGGSPAQIVAVLSGLSGDQALAPPAANLSDDWASDLTRMQSAGAACIDAYFAELQTHPAETLDEAQKAIKTGACDTSAGPWFSAYLTIAWAAIDADAHIQAARASPDLLAKEAATVKAAYADTAGRKAADNVSSRTLAMQALAAWSVGRSYDDLINTLTLLGGADYATADPVFTAAIAAAKQAKAVEPASSPRLSLIAAAQAHAAAQAYVLSAAGG